MKKRITLVLFLLVIAALTVFVACGNDGTTNYGTLTFTDISVTEGSELTIKPIFSDESKTENITYTFEGNNISITDGVVKGLVAPSETVVTAKTSHHSAKFKVTVTPDYGTLAVDDITLTFAQETLINPIFSKEEYECDINYSFEGNNISIADGLIKGLVPDTQTTVTATTEHHSATFTVTVEYITAVLTDKNGEESKFAIATPDADNYVVTGKINVEQFRENVWTRLTAFAFNGSDNSWYNVELHGNGDAILYGRFNDVEKYHIKLFNINDEGIMTNGKFGYTFALLKAGQETKFFINDDLVCAFYNDDMTGYAKLGALEVTGCANREERGEYKTVISELYYALENSDVYEKYASSAATSIEYDDFTLEAQDGTERKFSLGIPDIKLGGNYIFSATVSVDTYDPDLTRIGAYAFNGSNNSWYNIEMNSAGDAILYGRFNGVEKYHIRLFNKNDEEVAADGKIVYTVGLLKKGQNTYFFINNKLVCAFFEDELNGYGKLSTLEITAATDVWADRGAYSISFKDVKIENLESENFVRFDAMTDPDLNYADATLSNADGSESKFGLGNLNIINDYVYTATVSVKQYRENGWMRTSAFAFNGSDNSWYNIEMGGDGQLTLYARFNGVEKYGIPLFNINDEGVLQEDGSFGYDVAILKNGRNTYFFINGALVCSFSAAELSGYGALGSLEISACANRDNAGEYNVVLENQKIENSSSAAFAEYGALIANAAK